ncbi:MAG: DUF4382 domain-containing protein [Candidatus Micrarchaeota archaeon]|nr:DUF4382 domain-containing protein [Candidatus Micrarchaeota archaeon]
MAVSKMTIGAIAIVVIAVIGIASVYSVMQRAQGGAGTASLPITLTDPPQVPSGTSSLLVTYSSVQVHVVESANATPPWVSASGSGTVNLMQLLNLSQTIATASVPKNSTIDMVRFNVTSSTITINGTTYNVTVPSGRITAHIQSKALSNGSTTLLLQLSPTVASVITANSTLFVMVPSLKAVIVPGNGTYASAKLQIGNRTRLTEQDRAELENHSSNITITSASMAVAGNDTSISVTVRNNANSSVSLKSLSMFGNESVKLNTTGIAQRAQELSSLLIANISNSSVCRQSNSTGARTNESAGANGTASGGSGAANASAHASISINESGAASHNTREQRRPSFVEDGFGPALNSSSIASVNVEDTGMSVEAGIRGAEDINVHLNSSVCSAAGQSAFRTQVLNQLSNMSTESGNLQDHIRMLVFRLNSSGTLSVPSSDSEFEGTGVLLAPNQSMTFSFNGTIRFAQAHVLIAPVNGDAYRLVVSGEEGASASANVTAG